MIPEKVNDFDSLLVLIVNKGEREPRSPSLVRAETPAQVIHKAA